jgi:hypothetical protein
MSVGPLGFEGGDVNLNRYTGNDPTNAIDASGLFQIQPQAANQAQAPKPQSFDPKIVPNTTNKDRIPIGGSSGSVSWSVQFEIPDEHKGKNGWIIQRVRIEFDVRDVNDEPISEERLQEIVNKDLKVLRSGYWEAWEFDGKKVVWNGPVSSMQPLNRTSGDMYFTPDFGAGTKGTIRFIGEVKAFPGKLPPNMKEVMGSPAGALPYSPKEPPGWDNGQQGVPHILAFTWDSTSKNLSEWKKTKVTELVWKKKD